MTWEADLTMTLRDMKARGMTFEDAWAEAMIVCPPRGRYLGPAQAELGAESIVQFMERVCDDAWHDRKPELARLPILMEAIGYDCSGYARPRGPARRAA